MSTTAQEIGDAAVLGSIREGLAELTAPQRELFDRIYPAATLGDKLHEAHDLIQRTLAKNRAGR